MNIKTQRDRQSKRDIPRQSRRQIDKGRHRDRQNKTDKQTKADTETDGPRQRNTDWNIKQDRDILWTGFTEPIRLTHAYVRDQSERAHLAMKTGRIRSRRPLNLEEKWRPSRLVARSPSPPHHVTPNTQLPEEKMGKTLKCDKISNKY